MELVYSVKVDVAVPTGAVAEVTYWNPPQTIERRGWGVFTEDFNEVLSRMYIRKQLGRGARTTFRPVLAHCSQSLL